MNNKAIQYQQLLTRIFNIVTILEEIGIDTTEYREKLDNIKEKVKTESQQSIDKSNVPELETTINNYQIGISELSDLNKEIVKKHGEYVKIYDLVSRVDFNLNKDNNLTEEKVKDCSKIIIDILKKVESSPTEVYKYYETLIEKIYGLTYEMIKMETLYFDKSDIFDYIKESGFASSIISKKIKEDLIESKISLPLNTYDIDNPYLNYEFIKLVTEKTIPQSSLETRLEEIGNQVNYINKSNPLYEKFKDLQQKLGKRAKNNSKIKVNIAAIILTLIATEGIGCIIKKTDTKELYPRTTISYDSRGYYKKIDDYVERKNLEEDLTIINIYGISLDDDNPAISKIQYDASDISLPNLEDYLKIDTKKLKPISKEPTEDYFSTDYKKVIQVKTDENNPELTTSLEGQTFSIIFMMLGPTISTLLGLFKLDPLRKKQKELEVTEDDLKLVDEIAKEITKNDEIRQKYQYYKDKYEGKNLPSISEETVSESIIKEDLPNVQKILAKTKVRKKQK